jgi:hypothetical protein
VKKEEVKGSMALYDNIGRNEHDGPAVEVTKIVRNGDKFRLFELDFNVSFETVCGLVMGARLTHSVNDRGENLENMKEGKKVLRYSATETCFFAPINQAVRLYNSLEDEYITAKFTLLEKASDNEVQSVSNQTKIKKIKEYLE